MNSTAPVSRARYSAFTKEEITHAFNNLVGVAAIWFTGSQATLCDLCGGAGVAALCALVALLGCYVVYRYLDGYFSNRMPLFNGKGMDNGVVRP